MQTQKDMIGQMADDYAEKFFKELRSLPVDHNGEYVTESDFAAVIAQAIDDFARRESATS